VYLVVLYLPEILEDLYYLEVLNHLEILDFHYFLELQ
jgi:hypothetical protein